MTILAEVVDVVIGVDTHRHTHTAVVVASNSGGLIDQVCIDADADGYAEVFELAASQEGPRAWAIEGTGSYGAGLARFLAERGEWVVEVERPHRPVRRNGAKSDPIDALRAAREVLGLDIDVLAAPRSNGVRAGLAALLMVRRSAVETSTVAQRQLHALVITSPEALRARFRGLSTTKMVALAAGLRSSSRHDTETAAAVAALRAVGRRCQMAQDEANEHERQIRDLVKAWRPDLLEVQGVGPIVAAVVLCAWSHPGRCRNESAFASLAGACPVPASSGQTVRHRLNRCGDRQLNRALHTIMLTRLLHDPATRAYIERRRQEGRSDREIKRCLKRYIARQIYRQLETPRTTSA